MTRKTAPALPDRIERLAPAEAQHVTEVAYPTKTGPVLYKLKNGQLRASRRLRPEGETVKVLQSICRLLDVSYSALRAERNRRIEADAAKAVADGIRARIAYLRQRGYRVSKIKGA